METVDQKKIQEAYEFILEQQKQKYKVSCLKYGVTGNGPDDITFACSKEQAISYVAVKFANKSGYDRTQYGRFINDFKKHGSAKPA
jgi:hypothetical protein